jgi:hypothetical protein
LQGKKKYFERASSISRPRSFGAQRLLASPLVFDILIERLIVPREDGGKDHILRPRPFYTARGDKNGHGLAGETPPERNLEVVTNPFNSSRIEVNFPSAKVKGACLFRSQLAHLPSARCPFFSWDAGVTNNSSHLFPQGIVEFLPIVEVVQVDGIFWSVSVI